MNSHFARRLGAFAVLALSVTATLSMAPGCARVHHDVVNNESKATGFRYYQGAWYLLVYTDPKLGKVGKLHFLPDQTAKMSATPYNFWASLEGTLDFENGVLTQSKAVGDETVVPKAVLTVAKEIIGALADAPPVDVSRSNPELYKITILGNTAEIKSKSGIQTVPLET